MKTFNTILIDDEAPARQRLARLLKDHDEQINIIGEASNGIEAIKMIDQIKPDLIFLDIQMPGLNGFQVLEQIIHKPLVIFCSAYDQYAIDAFEINSTDYILKPVKQERLVKSIERLPQQPNQESLQEVVSSMIRKYQSNHSEKKEPTSIPVKIGEKVVFVALPNISYFEAEEKLVRIYTSDGKSYLTDHSLKSLETKLPNWFIRISKSALINKQKIKEIKRYLGSKYIIYMQDQQLSRLTSGRNYKVVVQSLMQF
ncbi:response regulator transcription factor [Puteibacter caeruleilacunae]|nr:response regulator transcription factor [Puteibacter caeruleilacunae]